MIGRGAPRLLHWVAGAAAALVLLPVAYLVVRAGEGGDAALDALLRPAIAALVWRSLALAVTVGVVATVLAVGFAVALEARDMPLRRSLSVAIILPLAVPCYVGASAYVAGLSPLGPFGAALAALGVGPLVLEGFGWSALVLVIYTLPFAYLPVRAALARADGSLYEAARTLGRPPAAALAAALRTAVPRAAASGAVLVTLYSLGEFGAVSLFRYDAFPRVIYLQYLSAFDRTSAALSSLVLVGVVLGVLAVAMWLDRGDARASDRARPLRFELGRARYVALAGLAAYVVFAVAVPVGSIAWWMVRGGMSARGAWSALGTSLTAAAVVVPPALLFAVALAVVSERSPRARPLARIGDIGFALPGLVVALGLTFFVLRVLPSLYQGWVPYAAAMLILFVPLAVASVRGALASVPPALDEAARTLGASPAAALRRVTLPLVAPGVLGGAALVAISTMKELSASLLLVPTGQATLATRLWSATEEARYAEAALPALLLVALAAAAAFVAQGVGRTA